MAIQQTVNLSLTLNGDGVTTSFTYSFNQLFAGTFDSPVISPDTIPSSALLTSISGQIPPGGSASLDGFGNLVLAFPVAWMGVGNCNIELYFNSGTLAGTTTSWTSATAANTAWTLPLNGNPAVLVPITISGTVTGGALQFQGSADGANWFTLSGTIGSTPQTIAQWNLASGGTAIQFNVAGYSYFRVILISTVVGTGTASFIIQSIGENLVPYVSAGALAIYGSSAPSTSNGAGVPLQADAYGNLYVNNIRRSQVVPVMGNVASTTAATLCPAQGAGIFADLASIVLTCRLGATAAVIFGVNVSDGTRTYRFNMSSESTATGGGNPPLVIPFDPPIPASNANVAWTIALTSATDTPSVDYVCTFVKQQVS